MLEESKKSYIREAAIIPNWQNTSVNVLANAYIDNENDDMLKSAYFATILLKKWPYIGKLYTLSKTSGFSIEDCYDMVVHGIQYALEKRKWRDPENKLYHDKCGPDKVLNRCIASSRDIEYYNSNTHKRRANFGKTSLDSIEENVKDCTLILSDDTELTEDFKADVSLNLLVENLLTSDKVLEALIISNIVAGDCFITKVSSSKVIIDDEKETIKKYTPIFKLSKLTANLYSYSEETLRNICRNYCISNEKEESLINLFKNTKRMKFDKVIKATLESMSKDQSIRNHICS